MQESQKQKLLTKSIGTLIIIALSLLSFTFVVIKTKAKGPQAESFASLSQQELVDIQGPGIKALEIDLRQPRLVKNVDGISFDEREGAKHANAFLVPKGSLESEALEVPFSQGSVSLIWGGENSVSDRVFGYIRTSSNLRKWSQWIAVESAGYEFTSTTLFESASVSIPPGAKYLQFRLELQSDNLGSGPTVDRVRLNYTAQDADLTSREDRGLAQSQADQTILKQQSVVTAQAVSAPAIISRTEWGCPDGEGAPDWPPMADNTPITHLVVHHTLLGTQPKNPNDYKAWVKNIWDLHHKSKLLGGKGYGDIAYNLLIDPKGNVYEGRAGGVDEKGAHFSCYNSHTTGIALLGDFTSALPTKQALAALEQVLAWRASAWRIDPRISVILNSPDPTRPVRIIPTIAGHLDINPVTWSCDNNNDDRTCPGLAFYGLLPGIRNDVTNMVPPGFSIQAQSNSQMIFLTQGQQASIGLNLDSYGGLSGAASVLVTGLPAGMSATPVSINVPSNGNATATLILKSSLSTPTGLFAPTITATLGGIQRSTTVIITVTGAPGSVTVKAMSNGQPWSGNVDYNVVGPQGVILGLAVPLTASNLPAGQYTLIYNAGGPSNFVNITPASSQTLVNGGALTFTLNFGTTTPNPLTVKCSASPSVITTVQSSTFSATASGGVGPYLYTWTGVVTGTGPTISKSFSTAGTFAATVTASDGSLQRAQSTCSVQVNSAVPASFDLFDFVPSQTVPAGQSAAFDLYVQPQNGFSGQVSFSLAGLPSGAAMTSSSVLNVSGTNAIHYVLLIQTNTGTPVGIFPLTITASGGGITRTASLTLTVTAPPPQPLSASCRIDPNPITIGQGATAYAQGSGGVLPYRYRINGVDMGTISSLLVMPSQTGTFTIPVTVFDNQNQQASSSCSAQVVAADPYLTGFNYTPNPAKAGQRVDLNIYGGNFTTSTQVWFVGPGCTAPGCQTSVVTVSGTAYIAAAAVLNLTGSYTVNIRNGSGAWVKAGTVTVVQ